ncbi:Lrp/AsnC family transcriptional regulator [Pannonibacter tanglangensis]|uniref:AsnC family transcriptional regulator n=1 Tax=Pannonibacter tanglangensis TaxID=2750084 RepID=A0ABW9ZJN2_9HYPH|nr:Lrp/AsnC family transcriptional regulator [Pannonibacter sp. XCT-34]NBN65021.1 AsnC family transcriptional regulator [Pannonibacter sp. XCT-34]
MGQPANDRQPLDPTDLAILDILQVDARISVSELGRRVGLSQPATSERMKRLEDRGVISGYAARVNPAALGLDMMAVVRLRTTHDRIAECLSRFQQLPQVLEVLRLTGEDCFLLKVLVPTPSALETLVDDIGRFGPVTTSLVLRSEPLKPVSRALLRRG